uniref:T-cell surface glycoprotein CD3 epsilon chain-like n=1 Tax=Scatophagus argus TaxID=75038 RepID=UPI001ED8268D|nr:T-cell surface glycoprotein CD3 epsilon chain-like [Scatophagus argus]
MGVRAAIAVLLLFIAPVKADPVTFSGKKVTLTCPENGTSWYEKGEKRPETGKELKIQYENDKKGIYHCDYDETVTGTKQHYYFYVQGKACENCFELDGLLLLLVIIVDVFVTGFLMAIIYRCTKKRGSAGPVHTSRGPARSVARGPPVPSPDYESLNPHTLSQDTYSAMNKMS